MAAGGKNAGSVSQRDDGASGVSNDFPGAYSAGNCYLLRKRLSSLCTLPRGTRLCQDRSITKKEFVEVNIQTCFEIRENPRFYCRDGQGRLDGQQYSDNKLCFTASDFELLATHLLHLSQRTDCVFVKFSVEAHGGMYLGRCFLLTDSAVGEVWAIYKCHPTLLCTVQNDSFVADYRDASDEYDDWWVSEYDTKVGDTARPKIANP